MSRRRFANDFPIERVRGFQVITPSKARRALVRRIEWLIAKIDYESSQNRGPMMDELNAMAQALELFDQAHPIDAATKGGPR